MAEDAPAPIVETFWRKIRRLASKRIRHPHGGSLAALFLLLGIVVIWRGTYLWEGLGLLLSSIGLIVLGLSRTTRWIPYSLLLAVLTCALIAAAQERPLPSLPPDPTPGQSR